MMRVAAKMLWQLVRLSSRSVPYPVMLATSREAAALRRRGSLTRIEQIYLKLLRRRFGGLSRRWCASIPSELEIGEGAVFPHGFNGVHIAKEARIGRNCQIMQHVTIGVNIIRDGAAPIIGDDVFIGASAVLIGRCTIGRGAKIGAGVTLVDADVPAGATIINKSAFNLTTGAFVHPQNAGGGLQQARRVTPA